MDNKKLVFGILMFVIFLVFIVQAINIAISYRIEKQNLLEKEKETDDLAELRSRLIREELKKINTKDDN